MAIRLWDVAEEKYAVYGELSGLDKPTVEFDEETGRITAEGIQGRIEGQATKSRISESGLDLFIRADVDEKGTTWILHGVSPEDMEAFRQAHYQWSE
jgi:hypothetical protein